MTPPPPDSVDPRDIERLAATDALLDRLGARVPSPDDLDDPVVAALALMAAEIDLDAVPLDATRAALSARSGPSPPVHEQGSAGPVLDLRDATLGAAATAWPAEDEWPDSGADAGDAADDDLAGPVAPVRAHSAVGRPDPLRRPRRQPRRPEPGPSAIAPPRSLPRMYSSRPGPGRPGEARERRMRPGTIVVIAVAAIVLGSGVSAAVTGGRSVNPLTGIQQVVAVITGNRTPEQQHAYDDAERRIAEARAAVRTGQTTRAKSLLDGIDLGALTSDDQARLRQEAAAVRASLPG